MRLMSKAVLASLVVFLFGCGGNPVPCPPLCPPVPGEPYSCANEQTARAAGQSIGALVIPEGVENPNRWIVKFSAAAPRGIRALQAQDVNAFVAQFTGVSLLSTLESGIVVEGGQDVILQLLSNPSVSRIYYDGIKSVPTPPDPARIQAVGPEAIPGDQDRHDQQDQPLDGRFEPEGTGHGILVGIVDTGSEAHQDYEGRLIEWCFTAHTFGGCRDLHGHGTHVATNAVGTTLGIAPEAQLASVRVLNENGSGADSDVIRGIEAFTAYCVENGLKCVGNMSLGGGVSEPLAEAVAKSYQQGVAWAVAAGNDSSDACEGTPSNVECVLTTAAFDHRDDKSAYFTNTGACVDGYAAGVETLGGTPQGGTTRMSGTSMASPNVAGILAAAWSAHPEFTVDELYGYVKGRMVQGTLDSVPDGTVNGMFYVGKE